MSITESCIIGGGTISDTEKWLLCPICQGKTRNKLREDTELKNFPLFCPKCKQETLIDVLRYKVTTIKTK